MEWIDEQLALHNKPRRALAEAVPGMTETKLSLVMSGSRRLSAAEADAIQKFFGYPLVDDPEDPVGAKIFDLIAKLGDGQKRAVALYLEALSDDGRPRPRAS